MTYPHYCKVAQTTTAFGYKREYKAEDDRIVSNMAIAARFKSQLLLQSTITSLVSQCPNSKPVSPSMHDIEPENRQRLRQLLGIGAAIQSKI
jgi:hypothetical protein